jgi:acyl-coenzyme A synthetase/AMP-(fatty) acid ligase
LTSLVPPPVLFEGRLWTGEEIARLARAWRRDLFDVLSEVEEPVATVVVNRPEGIALFFALSSFHSPVIVLPPEPSEWHSSPPIPPGTRLFLPTAVAAAQRAADPLGLDVVVVEDASQLSDPSGDVAFLTAPGVVLFTSGSTDHPKPVYRRMAQVLAVAGDLMLAARAAAGSRITSALPIARPFGFNTALMAATVSGSQLALQDRFDPHALLELFATGHYHYWTGTPAMADLLSRAAPRGWRSARPPMCLVAGGVSARLADQFEERVGAPLRQVYGSTEVGTITADVRNGGRRGTSGHPLPGTRLHIGDNPQAAAPPGVSGRIWIEAPRYLMQGYGYPPNVEPREEVDGWWPTPDLGHMDESGRLTVDGRVDDCFRTNAGQLVNTSTVSQIAEELSGVTCAAAVPVSTTNGPALGLLAESHEGTVVADLRRHLARALPAWAQPHVVSTTRALPRLPSGKVDRRTCIALLEDVLSGR